jgi:hypothetical protein
MCKNVVRVARWDFEPCQRLRSIVEEDACYGID